MDFSHHAQLFLVSDVRETPFDMAALSQMSEVTTLQTDTFSIGEVRKLIDTAYARPFEKETRTIVVRANAIGLEAQNALLKVLEEPPLTTRFILVLRQGCVVLPTVLSRVFTVPVSGQAAVVEHTTFNNFMTAEYAERMTNIALATKNKDIQTLDAWYAGLADWLARATDIPAVVRSRLLWCESMLTLNGASKKMLWEEIAFLLPVAKAQR